MQDASNADLAAAVESNDRVIDWKVEVDWNGQGNYDHPDSDVTDLVESVTVDRALNSALPESATLIDGYASASAKFSLSGESKGTPGLGIGWALSPYRKAGSVFRRSLAGLKTRISMGIRNGGSTEPLRQFTGTTRDVSLAQDDSSLSISMLDPSDRLRASITLPTYAVTLTQESEAGDGWLAQTDYNYSGYKPEDVFAGRINTKWLVDYVLRRNGLFAGPKPRDTAVIYVTNNGGPAPEIGNFVGYHGHSVYQTDYANGPYGEMVEKGTYLVGGPYSNESERWPTRLLVTGNRPIEVRYKRSFVVGCWLYFQPPEPAFADAGFNGVSLIRFNPFADTLGNLAYSTLYVNYYSPNQTLQIGMTHTDLGLPNSTVSPSIAVNQGWNYLAVGFSFDDFVQQVGIHVRVNNTTYNYAGINYLPLVTRPSVAPLLEMLGGLPWCHLQVWTTDTDRLPADAASWANEERFVPQVSIPAGTNHLYYLPDVVGADSWELLQDVAEAENGQIGFDEYGQFFFRPRNATASSVATTEKVIDLSGKADAVKYKISSDTIRNVVTTTTQTGHFTGSSGGGTEPVWKLSSPDAIEVPVGTWDFPVELPAMSTLPFQRPTYVGAAGWQNNTFPSAFAVSAATEPTREVTFGVRVAAWQTGPRSGMVRVWNVCGEAVKFRTPASADQGGNDGGTPTLQLRGNRVVLDAAIIHDHRAEGSIAKFGERVLTLPASPWRQSYGKFEELANQLLASLSSPVPVLEDIDVDGDPRIQLGDTVSLITRADELDIRGTVVKLTRTLSRYGGFTDSLTVRPIAPPGHGVLDDAEFGVLSASLVLAP